MLLVADDRSAVTAQSEVIAALLRGGCAVRACYRRGADVTTDSEGELQEHRLRASGPNPLRRGLAQGLALAGDLRRFAPRDPWFRQALTQTSVVILLDRAADTVQPFLQRREALHVVPSTAADAHLAELHTTYALRAAAAEVARRTSKGGSDPLDEAHTVTAIARVAGIPRLDPKHDGLLWDLLSGLHRWGGSSAVGQVLDHLTETVASPTNLLVNAWRALTDLDLRGQTSSDPVDLAARLLEESARHLGESEDVAILADRTSLALQLAFHRELHSDVLRGPLVEDPDGYLAPLRRTAIWRTITSPSPRRTVEPRRQRKTRRRVTVLPGAYPRFATGLVEAIAERGDLEVATLDLRELDRRFGTMGVWPLAVEQRLRAALGLDVAWSATEGVRTSSTVIADWADKGAVWASLISPPAARLVVRVHAVDALRPWIHLVDWGRVDEVVFVAEHMKDLVRAELGAALDGVTIRVLPPPIPEAPRLGAPRPSGCRTLAMVGWAQRVKDPLMALEILAELRRTGASWRLILIGADFAETGPASGVQYAQRFRQRALADDIRDAIVYTGYLKDVRPALLEASHILSTSVREGQPFAVIDGMMAGAVPVIREWPQFASTQAARRIYGDRWVIDSVAEAVAMIQATSSDQAHRRESAAVHNWLVSNWHNRNSARELRELVGLPARRKRSTRLLSDADSIQTTDPGESAPQRPASEPIREQIGEHHRRGDHQSGFDLAVQHLDVLGDDPDTLLQVSAAATTVGSLSLQLEAARRLTEIRPRDGRAHRLAERIQGRWNEVDPAWSPTIGPAVDVRLPQTFTSVRGRILHVLKISMPYRQSGYSMRGMYTLLGQQASGLEPVAVTALDFPVSIGVSNPPGTENVDGVRHLRLLRSFVPREERRDAHLDDWATALAHVVAQERPEIIHAHSGHRGYEGAMVALAVARRFGLPLIYEVRGFFEALWTSDLDWAERGELYHLRRAAETRIMQAADGVVTLSESMRRDIIDRGIPADRVTVVPNGADTDRFTPRPRDSDLTERLGLSDRFVFGYVSNLDHPREGHELLIDAAVKLRQRGIPATALIVGDGQRREILQRYASDRDAADCVVFTGEVSHEEVLAYYGQYDVFVIPRIDERAARLVTPLKPFEAMAAGIPMVVSDLPALTEITGDGARGDTFAVGDANDLTDTLERLWQDPERREALSVSARQWVVAERQWAGNGARYREVYRALRQRS